ncbi:MAG TPA: MATE family efflux transporter [Candidatus Pelethocola excrementipullorum]|nr:MATE family efflux transporter [Candidatus Pelethocola excrementipullorum]
MIRSGSFYKGFFGLTFAIALQNLLTYSVGLADNLMLGAYDQTALSGVALCNQIQFLLQMLVSGASDGVVVIGAQYWGQGKLEPIVQIIGAALRYALGIGLIIFGIVICFPSQVLGLLTNDPEIIAAGTEYLRIICFSYLIFAVSNVLAASLRSVGIVKIGYMISGSTLCINICLNYCLIYGNFGMPELGIRGSAIATLIARIVEFIIIVIYFKYKKTGLAITPKKLLKVDKRYREDYRRFSLPVLLNQFQWGIAQSVQTAVLGHLGGTAIVANSIAVITFQILSVVVYGSAGASGLMIGKTIGEGKKEKLKEMVKTLQIVFVGLGLVAGLGILLASGPILSFYNITEEAQGLARQFIVIMAVTTIGTAYQMSCDSGIIRAGGDTSFSAKMNFISMWGMIVPLSCIGAFVLRLPTVVVFFLLKWDQIYKCIPVAIRLHSWRWIRIATREDV